MVLQPKVLILDEPTSQLDPIAASDFLATLGKINRELGTTIILTEHRLEEAFSFASRVAVMDGGRLLCTGMPAEVGRGAERPRQRHVPRYACRHAHLERNGFQSDLPHLRLRRTELAAGVCQNA